MRQQLHILLLGQGLVAGHQRLRLSRGAVADGDAAGLGLQQRPEHARCRAPGTDQQEIGPGQPQTVGVVGVNLPVGADEQGIGRPGQHHPLAAGVGATGRVVLEGNGDVGPFAALGDKVAQTVGKTIQRSQTRLVIEVLPGQLRKALVNPGRTAVPNGVAKYAVIVRCCHRMAA